MAKAESTFKNMVLSLTLISLGASACLGFVYKITKEPIERSSLKKRIDAIKQVVPEFNNNPYKDMFRMALKDGDSLDIYPAKKDNETVGYAVSTFSSRGFSGKIDIMVGFRPDKSIYNISVLEQKETPGLGAKMTEPAFKDQFIDKKPESFTLKVKKDGGNVDAISSATISSRAFCDAVLKAYNVLFLDQNSTDATSGSTHTSQKNYGTHDRDNNGNKK